MLLCEMREKCPHCKSEDTKKNGHTHYGKQNYRCKKCGRQFVIGGQNWFISDTQKELIDKLLLERISLAGISRVLNISEPWISAYIDKKYEALPDDLNADLTMPVQSDYLEDRFDEEINRLEKKSLNRANNTRK